MLQRFEEATALSLSSFFLKKKNYLLLWTRTWEVQVQVLSKCSPKRVFGSCIRRFKCLETESALSMGLFSIQHHSCGSRFLYWSL